MLEAYTHADEIKELIPILPKWQTGKCAPCFDGFDGSLDKLSAYYKENGCGMFARYKAFIWRDGDIQPVEHPTGLIWIHLRDMSVREVRL